VWGENRPSPLRRRLYNSVTTNVLHCEILPDYNELNGKAAKECQLDGYFA